jgi:hypothetical protein
MECSIYALLACFSWSGLYLDGGLSWQDRGEMRVTQYGAADADLSDDVFRSTPYVWTSTEPLNQYGDISIGYEIVIGATTVSAELTHRSSIATGRDDGMNYVRIGLRWHLFRR